MALLNLCTSVFLTHFLQCKPNAQALFSHHRKEFDRCMHLILQKYPPDDKVFAITTLIGLRYPEWLGQQVAPLLHLSRPSAEMLRRLFLPDPFESWVLESSHRIFLLLEHISGPCSPPEWVHEMIQFFSDTSRSKDYALSGTRYAAASLACLTNICKEHLYKLAHYDKTNWDFMCVHLFYSTRRILYSR